MVLSITNFRAGRRIPREEKLKIKILVRDPALHTIDLEITGNFRANIYPFIESNC